MDKFRLDIGDAQHRHHRHQASLEGVIQFHSTTQLTASERSQARTKFRNIIDHFSTLNPGLGANPYDRLKLVELSYEYARSEESRDIYLHAFFHGANITIDDQTLDLNQQHVQDAIGSAICEFADFLLDSFFLPMRASFAQTPQILSPTMHNAVLQAQGGGVEDFTGTPGRLSNLRRDCLIRDQYKCVVTHQFDQNEFLRRYRKDGSAATDDEGNLLKSLRTAVLQAAHIIPHALTETEADGDLHQFKKAAVNILNMFDHGIVHLIEGENIDKPQNALSLTYDIHDLFGRFEIFFQAVPDRPHTYHIDTFVPILRDYLPTTRTLALSENRTVNPPSRRLLELHCAIAHILHLSAAGAYIERVLDDLDKRAVASDGTTELGRLVSLGLGGWLDKSICT